MKDILIIIFSALSLSLAIAFFVVFRQLKISNITLSKLMLALDAKDKSKPGLSLTEEQNDVHKENFIKFLSDSRDWAYEYIEDVQAGLTKFVSQVGPDIEYFKEYGDTMGMVPNYKSMEKISQAYDELKKLLPTDEV